MIGASFVAGATFFKESVPQGFIPRALQVSVPMENNAVQFGTFHISTNGTFSCFCSAAMTTGGNYINTNATYIL